MTLARGSRRLIEDASLQIHTGWRVGVVGANGSGKSSLFALLRGELHTEAGDCEVPARLAHRDRSAQETPPLPRPAIEFVLDGDTELRHVERALTAADAATRRPRARRVARAPRRHRRLRRARPRGRTAGRARLRAVRSRTAGRGLLGRLAHAAQSRAGAAEPRGPDAARRTDQPPRSRRRGLAGALARELPRHAAARLARPGLPRRLRSPTSRTSSTAR